MGRTSTATQILLSAMRYGRQIHAAHLQSNLLSHYEQQLTKRIIGSKNFDQNNFYI